MKVLNAMIHSIKEASTVIQKGGLVAFPTETVYGLGADALNPPAMDWLRRASAKNTMIKNGGQKNGRT